MITPLGTSVPAHPIVVQPVPLGQHLGVVDLQVRAGHHELALDELLARWHQRRGCLRGSAEVLVANHAEQPHAVAFADVDRDRSTSHSVGAFEEAGELEGRGLLTSELAIRRLRVRRHHVGQRSHAELPRPLVRVTSPVAPGSQAARGTVTSPQSCDESAAGVEP